MKQKLLLALFVAIGCLSCENPTTSEPYNPEGVYYGPAHLVLHNNDFETSYLASCETYIENTTGSEYRFVVTIPGYLHDTLFINVNQGWGYYQLSPTDTILGNFIPDEDKFVLDYTLQDTTYVIRGERY